jgi:ribonuclease J
MSDSTNSFRKGFSKSESQVTEVLRDVVEKADGRVIVATFSQLVVRINQLLELAKQQGRKVAIAGRSLETTINIAKNLGYIKVPDNLIVPIHKIENFEKKKQMIFTTGHQGETMAALARIARDEHKNVKITEGDTVILSSSVIPGNDLVVQKMIDELAQKGAKVFHQGIMDLHTGGHGYQEDQKLMINLVRPRFFIPVHGFQSFLAEHGRTAESVGIPKTNVLIPKDGEEILLDRKSIKRGAKYRSEPILVMREKGGEIEPQIIQERVQLAEAGFITITLGLDQKIKNLATQPVIFSKGFSVGKNTRNFIISLKEHIEQISTGILNSEQDKDKIGVLFEEQINKFIKKSIGIDPLILIFLNFKPQTHEDKNNQA